jgi:hypothetical protein
MAERERRTQHQIEERFVNETRHRLERGLAHHADVPTGFPFHDATDRDR